MEKESFKIGDLLKWDKIEDYIYPRIMREDEIKNYLDVFPYTKLADLFVVYMVKLPPLGKEIATVIIKNEYLEVWEKEIEELHKKAVENISKAPVSFRPLLDFVKDLTEEVTVSEPDKNMYVLTNEEKTFGASEILNTCIMQKISEDLECDCIIIPSSLHEVLILEDKDIDDKDYATIRYMVKEVNSSCVEPRDRLSDNIYRYSRENGEISIIE